MKLNKIQLGKTAKQLGFVRDTLEKVIRLTEVLKFISLDNILGKHLALKGGTAINLTVFELKRLSVDIDMDFIPNTTKEKMTELRNEIKQKLVTYMELNDYQLQVEKSKFTYSLDSFVFFYQNTGGMKDNIKVEINYSIREHIYPVKTAKIATLNGTFDEIEITTVRPVELFGSKLTALMGRAAARDLYDAWNMVQANLFSAEELIQLRKAVIFYSVLNLNSKEELFDIEHILTINSRKITRDLRPVIFTKEHLDLTEIQEVVMQFIRALLHLDENERAFIASFYDKKKYFPELLFQDANQSKRLEKHPMMLWKLAQLDS